MGLIFWFEYWVGFLRGMEDTELFWYSIVLEVVLGLLFGCNDHLSLPLISFLTGQYSTVKS